MAQVLLKNLTKKFDEVVAVNTVDLEINDREFVVLVGPSGCGKTTTLRMVAGLPLEWSPALKKSPKAISISETGW